MGLLKTLRGKIDNFMMADFYEDKYGQLRITYGSRDDGVSVKSVVEVRTSDGKDHTFLLDARNSIFELKRSDEGHLTNKAVCIGSSDKIPKEYQPLIDELSPEARSDLEISFHVPSVIRRRYDLTCKMDSQKQVRPER